MSLGDPFVSVSTALRQHYADAKGAQWSAEDIEWDAVAPTLDPGVRPETAKAYRARWTGFFMQVAELLVSTSARLAAGWDHLDAQLVLAVQAHDYARHLEVWRRYLDRLGAVAPAVESVQSCFQVLRDSPIPGPAVALSVRVYDAALDALYAMMDAGDVCQLRRRVIEPLRGDVARHLHIGETLLQALSGGEETVAQLDVARQAQDLWRAIESGLAPAAPGLWPTAEHVREAAALAHRRAA